MRRKKTKKGRVPEILWRIYGNRARTLAQTIVALLPPPLSSQQQCRCRRGKSCLACTGAADPMSFLLRSGDPSDYTSLLTRGFAVVSNTAPRFSGTSFNCRWSLKKIVERTIEIVLYSKEKSCNVICDGYNKHTQSSKVVDLFTTSAWSLLHNRIGDDFMVHILKFVSIFLPLARETHCQVSGSPIREMCSKFSKAAASGNHQPLPNSSDLPQKRKKFDSKDKLILEADITTKHSLGFDSSVSCCVGYNQKSCIRQCNRSGQMSICEAKMPISCSIINRDQNEASKELPQKSIEENGNAKHTRPRKRRKLAFAETLASHTSTISGTETGNREQTQNIFTSFNHHLLKTTYIKESEPTSEMCFCLWMIQAKQNIPQSTQIDRHTMFYNSHDISSLLPRNHVLNTSKANDVGAISVFKEIFGLSDESLISSHLSCHTCRFCVNDSPCLFHSIIQLIKRLIRKYRRCKYLKLIDKHCTVPIMEEECILPLAKSKNSSSDGYQFEQSRSCCPKSQVVSFLWAVCKSILPLELLGPPSNWRSLIRNISKFVHLRKFEKFSLKQCMHGLKSSYIPLLLNEYSSCYLNNHLSDRSEDVLNKCRKFGCTIVLLKNIIFSHWIFWVFSCIIRPILQTNFYVTEIECGKLDTFYYRKPFWKKLYCGNAGVDFFKECNYSLFRDEDRLLRTLEKRPFGFSKVRFLPKANGVRVLTNLKAPSKYVPYVQQSLDKAHSKGMKGRVLNFMPVNKVLRDLSAVLKGLKRKHPEMLGSSVFDYNDVYDKLAPFVLGLKNGSKKRRKTFIVVCDISRAFDCINQDKLINVMKGVIRDEEYVLELLPEVICTKKSLWVHPHQMLLDRNMSLTTTRLRTSIPYHVLHRVQIIQEKTKTSRKVHLHHHLYEHVKGNVLQFEKKFFLQGSGIAQGSIVSSLLCSYYLANMETEVILPFLRKLQEHHISEYSDRSLSERFICQDNGAIKEGPELIRETDHNHVMLRFIDDFLFISTSKEHATSFFSRMKKGFRDYNCFINEKSCINFDAPCASDHALNNVYKGDDGTPFLPWSGLLINAHTLEIQADYRRYLDTHISSTLTVCWQDRPGRHLKEKLQQYLRPKCHAIFYDSKINSAPVVRLNVYQAFLLCSMKFHSYVCDLSPICTLRAEHHFEIITTSVRYMYTLIKRRMYSTNVGRNVHPVLKLQKKEVIWLGLNAYIRVLKRKQPHYSKLVSLLKSELLRFQVEKSASLKYAIDDSHSSLFWKIKY